MQKSLFHNAVFNKLGFVLLLILLEIPIAATIYDPQNFVGASELWKSVNFKISKIVPFALFATLAFIFLLWPKKEEILSQFEVVSSEHPWKFWLRLHVIIYLLLLLSTFALNNYGMSSGETPWLLFFLWVNVAVISCATLLLFLAPITFWLSFINQFKFEIFLSVLCGGFILLASIASQNSWGTLANATFTLSYNLLILYETGVYVEADKFNLGVNNFIVNVGIPCSGYEGIGLVTSFLSLYIWLFRKSLKFPNVLLLLPIGICVIWLLNVVRISVLISIGAHFSPDVAIGGFHSHAGWILFLLVTLGLMILSYNLSFFSKKVITKKRDDYDNSAITLASALLLPFLVFMVASIIIAAFTVQNSWSYIFKVIPITLVLWIYRNEYRRIFVSFSGLSLLLGCAIGIVWVLTDPSLGTETKLESWLETLPLYAFIIWITLRFFGLIVLVPLAEEFAFRGYLHRALIAQRFETVSYGQFSWLAFIISSVVFGLLHDRWVAGILAGACFALLMYRYNRLSDPIVAHMSANAVIAVWAISANEWGLV